MTPINESKIWTQDVKMMDPGDKVVGGQDGPINQSLESLSNRTDYLRALAVAVMKQAEITPAADDTAQLLQAIAKLIAAGTAASADKLTNKRQIGGVDFDGTADVYLPVAGGYSATQRYTPGSFVFVDGNYYECYHPDGCIGKDPRDPTNRPEAWGVTDVSQPYYWIKIGPWLELPPVGSPIYLPSTTLTEGLIKYRGDGLLHKDKFWRLAYRHSSLVSGDYVKIAELRAEFLRGLDDGRGIDLNRVINSAQLDAIENIKGQFQMQGFEGSIAISNTGPFYSERVGFNAAAGSYYGAYKALFDLSRSNRTANETRSRNIAMLAATRI